MPISLFLYALPQATGNTWLFSTCISYQCYTNLNQPHFTKFIHFFAGRGESPEFRGRGDSSERTGYPWGLPPPAGNTWLFSTCISHHSYTNLNQPYFKYLSPNSFTFFAGCGESPGFKGRGNSSERTIHPWGLPQGTGNIWFISPCIHQD